MTAIRTDDVPSDIRVSSFDPVMPINPKILILGSMPGVVSLRHVQYYAHPRNAFWPIIGDIANFDSNRTYAKRIAELKRARIALWDVFKQCNRRGSLDSAISDRNMQINDISALLNEKRTIKAVFLNGTKAAAVFRRYVLDDVPASVKVIELPSTSPANARMTFAEKRNAWQCIADYL